MKLLLVLLLAASVSAGSFRVGNIKCTFGPSYWCANYKQAKECDAIQHCKEKVWKQKVSSNVSCTTCELAVTGFKFELSKPAFQKQIVAKLEGACVKFSALAPECRAIIEKYSPVIIKELLKMMSDPKKFCTQLGLCKASKERIMAVLLNKAIAAKMKAFKGIAMKKHVRNLYKSMPIKSSAECILCEFIASKLEQTLTKNATEQEIKNAVEKVCSLLPTDIRAECTEFVQEYSVEIIQLLAQELNPKMLCTALGLCNSKGKMKRLKSNGEVCDFCTTVLTYFKNLLQDNTTEGEIVDGLKQLCDYLPDQIKSECTALVSQYGMQVLKLIASSDPKTLCSDVGLCTSKGKKVHVAALKDNCYFGASYWCASRANAIHCKKTAFCLKYGWLPK